jgi:hypothetical protein
VDRVQVWLGDVGLDEREEAVLLQSHVGAQCLSRVPQIPAATRNVVARAMKRQQHDFSRDGPLSPVTCDRRTLPLA